jgi:transglutaminase/protease-like cytokinesis protein 3
MNYHHTKFTFLTTLAFFLLVTTSAHSENQSVYQRIDQYALKTPSYVTSSVNELTDYLMASAWNDIEKARVIFKWITSNVIYDVPMLRSGKPCAMTPSQVLEKRSAICQGYAVLFDAMAKRAGLETVIISGYSKGEGFFTGKLDDRSRHAWNAVQIDGKWRLLDCTWGAGCLDDSGCFAQAFEEHFFLTSPDEMIFTHFPTNPEWQLLGQPITSEQFLSLPRLKPAFFKHGLKINSNRLTHIKTNDELTVTLQAPKDVAIIASLWQDDCELDRSLTLSQYHDGLYYICAVFPSRGSYILRIFVNRNNSESFEWALDYDVEADSGAGVFASFPKTFLGFQQLGAYLHSPMQGYLKGNTEYLFMINVPGANRVGIIDGNNFIPLEKSPENDDDLYSGKVTTGSENIQIGVRFDEGNEYMILLEYKIM